MTAKVKSGVYLLHIDPPFKHARHYLGYAKDITKRVAEHQAGTGARLTQVVIKAGHTLTVARTWKGEDRTFERLLKNRKCTPKYCPICQAKKKAGKA